LRAKLTPIVDHAVLVLSPQGHEYVAARRAGFGADTFRHTSLGLQPAPRGMGDAVFCAADFWRDFDDILVVWGDQFNLSPQTLRACRQIHAALPQPALTLPLVWVPQPYVEYVFDAGGRLTQVRQSREGDFCTPNGFADVGVFLLSCGPPLLAEWHDYLARSGVGPLTREVNFLPFLAHLSLRAGWPVGRYETTDPAEAVGINTPADLAFARQLLQKQRHE
jgi:bifunctional UDP-N-acetylglucosamine pyrophosphorylase/glucosamine-1-phosphate N-acetyltransferase